MHEPKIGIDAKVAFLRQPESYPQRTHRVEAIETHMSWVFLAEEFAYKLKKPVRYDFLDFRTPTARRYYCNEEVRLNRRLAPDVYLGVVALGIDKQGHLQFDNGQAVDWLVKMRRLPRNRMLDYLIRHSLATTYDIDDIAQVLHQFYFSCPALAIEPGHYRQELINLIDNNESGLLSSAFQLPARQVRDICTVQRIFVQEMETEVKERLQAGKIIEGHGDLRPEHICLQPRVAIIDCLEFAYDLRVTDTIDEVAFLALECERLGAPDLGILLIRRYCEIADDWPARTLIDFYQSVKATLRAKITISHLKEEKYRYSPLWRQRALEYLRLAQMHAARC